ncbi:hypothetical protein [Salinisphaera sp.]|uniref:hypothetical protein n=1 Tax=Salinisphaera sp. TaxID=1914330 RepID=UPI002D7A246F|nr:hypothetical protein [Salinisphaera sp.]HET7313529.1 hypothetical protein [Salinisphaera sp.]
MIWLAGLMLVAFGAIAFLAVQLAQASRRLRAIEAEIARLGRELESEDREFESLMAEIGGSRIVLELTQPIALARQHSRWARALTGLAPRLIRRRVYDEAAAQMKQILTERGVAAEVQVFHPSGS